MNYSYPINHRLLNVIMLSFWRRFLLNRYSKRSSKSIPIWILSFAICVAFCSNVSFSQQVESYPQPVSEYVEKTGPGKMVFLSYPKYYRDGSGGLQLTDTTLRPSEEPGWDYEVTKGIWSLHVRTDGTFRASHAGDRFTYRFADLGIGRGSVFQSLELGNAKWDDFVVVGDSIRWRDVLPDVDVSVRYIHDILKVDVIVDRELVRRIRDDVQAGNLRGDDYLTARFEIPEFLVTNEARQGNEIRDLYQESLEINQPIGFYKDGDLYHSLRPVTIELLDDKGEPVLLQENNEIRQIRSAQVWQLSRDGAGVAEMSALLADLAELPDGNIGIDPSWEFREGYLSYTGCEDSFLYINVNENPNRSTFNYGAATTLALFAYDSGGGVYRETRPIFRFKNLEDYLPYRCIIDATLELYLDSHSGNSTPSEFNVIPYAIKDTSDNWVEGNGNHAEYSNENWVTWSHRQLYNNYTWSDAGAGEDDRNGMAGPAVDIVDITTAGETVSLPIHPGVIGKWIADSADGDEVNGIVLEAEDNSYSSWAYYWRSRNHATADSRPKLKVEYKGPIFGSWAGNDNDDIQGWEVDTRQDNMNDDHLNVIRYSGQRCTWRNDGDTIAGGVSFVASAAQNNMKVIIVFPAGWNPNIDGFTSATDYADYIEDFLVALSSPTNYISNGTVIAIEIGAEEDDTGRCKWTLSGGFPSETGGQEFAAYYLAVWEKLKQTQSHPEWKHLRIVSGGSFWDWYSLARTDDVVASKDFLKGYLDTMTQSQHFHKIPDMIGYHPYAGHWSPEGHDDTYECWKVNKEIVDMCKTRGFVPNCAATEYGFSPTFPPSGYQNTYTPNDQADYYTQAVYYIRARIMHTCMTPYPGVGMEACYSFYHPRSLDNCLVDTTNQMIDDMGFHNFDSATGSDRAIRHITRAMMDPSGNLKLGSSDIQVWLPIATFTHPTDDRYARCGFKSDTDVYWLVVWRYEQSQNFFDDNGVSVTFSLPGDYETNFTAQAYQFWMDDSVSAQTRTVNGQILTYYTHGTDDVDFDTVTLDTLDIDYSSGSTTFEIDPVDENPVFIRLFSQD